MRARISPVWGLTVVVAALAIALFTTVAAEMEPPISDVRLPWWLLALLFLVAEATVVHLHFRRDAHSFTLTEVPLALALAAAAPVEVLVGRLLGGGIVLLARGGRRFNSAKVSFNIALFMLEVTFALVVFHAIGGAGSLTRAVPAVLVAVGGASALAALLVALAMRVSGAEIERRELLLALGIAVGIAVTNACLGLVGIATLTVNPWLVPLLAVPAAAVFLGYRAYLDERRRRRHFEFLLETTRLVQRSREVEAALAALLTHAAEGFRAEFAQITLYSPEGGGRALRSTRHHDGTVETMVRVTLTDAELDAPTRATALEGERARAYGLRDAILAPLEGEAVIGTVLVGDHEGDVSTFDGDDVALFDAFAAHAGIALENERLETSLERLRELQEELQHQAFHDALTGLPNRLLFANRVESALVRSRGGGLAVLFVDLDDFKNVNDTMGHTLGDALLVAVAHRLRGAVSHSDTVARLGGDEFAVLLEDSEDVARAAAAVARRIVSALAADYRLDGGVTAVVGASVGVAVAEGRETGEELLRNADVAMYRAKAAGRACYAMFEPEMHAAVAQRAEATTALRRAVTGGELEVHYQPIFELDGGGIQAIEALARWQGPDGLVAPSDFIPLAEETGLITELGRHVLQTACRDAATWLADDGDSPPLLHVNISPQQLRGGELTTNVLAALRESGLPPQNLVLELTESVLMNDADGVARELDSLRILGVGLAIDDFGMGYSSLRYLQEFPFDVLKVGKPFIDRLAGPDPDQTLVELVLKLGGALGVDVVAEGIESELQRSLLVELGCALGQGFLFAAPTSAGRIRAVLAAARERTAAYAA